MTSTTIRRRKATTTPEQRAERATAQAARLADLHEHIAAGVEALTSTDEWRAMLDTARRFHTYSPTNQLLIYVQRPDATRVTGFTTWQALGRQVRKGEKGIAILAPCPRRGGGEDTTPDTPDAPGESGEDSGAGRGGRMRFTVAHVFDESQTDGDDLPEVLPTLLEGEGPAGLWDGLAAQATGHGYTIERGPCGQANGYTNPADHLVRVRDDVSDAQACKDPRPRARAHRVRARRGPHRLRRPPGPRRGRGRVRRLHRLRGAGHGYQRLHLRLRRPLGPGPPRAGPGQPRTTQAPTRPAPPRSGDRTAPGPRSHRRRPTAAPGPTGGP